MLTVNELATQSGLSPHTIRYYIRSGLLSPCATRENSYRLFAVQDIQRAKFICQTKRLGMSQQEIRQILVAGNKNGESEAQTNSLIASLIEERISIMNAEIKSMQYLQQETQQALGQFQRANKQHENENNIHHLIDAIASICE